MAVLCPGCRRAIADAAPTCPTCGHDLGAAVVQMVSDDRLDDVGSRPRHPRRRRLPLWAAVVGALVVAVVVSRGSAADDPATDTAATTTSQLTTTSGQPDSVPIGPLPRPTRTVLIGSLTDGRIDVADLDNAKRYVVYVPGPRVGDSQVIASGSGVAVRAHGRGYGIEMPAGGHPITYDLGVAEAIAASARSGSVWVVDDTDVVTERLLTGATVAPGRALPDRARLLAGVANGVLLEVPAGVEVWDPVTGTVVTPIGDQQTVVLGAAGRWVVWRDGNCPYPCAAAHLTDVTTGADSLVETGEWDVAFVGNHAVFAPSGEHFAMLLVGRDTDGQVTFAAAVVDTVDLAISTVDYGGNLLAWSSGGDIVFMSNGDLVAYRLAEGDVLRLGRFALGAAVSLAAS